MRHLKMLETDTAKYPLKHVVVSPHNVPFNAQSARITDIVKGDLPNRIIVGFVETKAFDGNYTSNPFNFKHFNISSIKLKLGSWSIPYTEGLKMDYENNRYTDGYDSLYKCLGYIPNFIDYFDYKGGFTLYAFDLTPDLCSGEHFNIPRDGTMDIEITFSEVPKDQSVTAIVYSEFDKVLEINRQRNAFMPR
jgi:hypothetical protein